MYTAYVFQASDGMYFMELCCNGIQGEWFPCRAKCKEHAEAEAEQRWPFAEYINGISV